MMQTFFGGFVLCLIFIPVLAGVGELISTFFGPDDIETSRVDTNLRYNHSKRRTELYRYHKLSNTYDWFDYPDLSYTDFRNWGEISGAGVIGRGKAR